MRRSLAGVLIGLAVVIVTFTVVSETRSDRGNTDGTAAPRATSSAPGAPTTTSPTTTPRTPTTTRPRRGNGQAVTFAFGGDVHFEGGLRSQLDTNTGGMFAPIAPTLSAADVPMVNLETPITRGGTPVPKAYNFRAPASAYEALRTAGVDVVTEANNHGVDYGPVGLADTLAAKHATSLGVVGIGANAAEAYAPWRTVVRGQRISVIGASDVIDDALVGSCTATDTHGGIASAKDANESRLIDAVRAARAGLGNFVFYNESGASGVSGVLTVTATGRDVGAYAWEPARIQAGIPHLLTGEAAAPDVAAFDGRRACTDLTP